VSVSILGVLLDNCVEVSDCLFVLLNHLVSLCSFVDILDLRGDDFDAHGKGEDSLLELLLVAVGQPNVVVNVSLVRNKRFVLQSLLQSTCALFVLASCVVTQSQLVKQLRIQHALSVPFQSSLQVGYRLFFDSVVEVALRSVHQKISVLRHGFNGPVEERNSSVEVLERMVTLPQTVVDSCQQLSVRLLLFNASLLLLSRFEVLDCLLESVVLVLANASAEIALRIFRVQINGFVEVSNGQHMIAHVLVYLASRNEHRAVVVDFKQHFGVALKSLGELVRAVVHLAQMESAAHEVLLDRQRLLEHFDCQPNQLQVLLLGLFEQKLSLALESEAFAVPQVGVVGADAESHVVVLVSQFEARIRFPIQVDVASVQVNAGVVGVLLKRDVKVLLGFLQAV
jgi:hypothetical protein